MPGFGHVHILREAGFVMGRTLASGLGWIEPSERLTKTIERAQYRAYREGVAEVNLDHLFAATLEDLDAVYFLARFEIPLGKLEEEFGVVAPSDPLTVPRLPAPVFNTQVRPAGQPYMDIAASAGLRRVMALASVLAEDRKAQFLDGGFVLEAMLEDGSSRGAASLRRHHAEMAQVRRILPLPGRAGVPGAMLTPSQAAALQQQIANQPAPQKKYLTGAEQQLQWLKAEIFREIEREVSYQFLQSLDAFTGKTRPYTSIPAMQLKDEAEAELAASHIYQAHAQVVDLESSAQMLNARVRDAALRVAEASPQLFQRFISLLPEPMASALQRAFAQRSEEREAMAAMHYHPAQMAAPSQPPAQNGAMHATVYRNGGVETAELRRVVSEEVRVVTRSVPPFYGENQYPLPDNAAGDYTAAALQKAQLGPKGAIRLFSRSRLKMLSPYGLAQKARARMTKLWVAVAAAGASLAGLTFLF
jgi:hypothetical protein